MVCGRPSSSKYHFNAKRLPCHAAAGVADWQPVSRREARPFNGCTHRTATAELHFAAVSAAAAAAGGGDWWWW